MSSTLLTSTGFFLRVSQYSAADSVRLFLGASSVFSETAALEEASAPLVEGNSFSCSSLSSESVDFVPLVKFAARSVRFSPNTNDSEEAAFGSAEGADDDVGSFSFSDSFGTVFVGAGAEDVAVAVSPNFVEESSVRGMKLGLELGAAFESLLASSAGFEVGQTVCVTEDSLLAVSPRNASLEGAKVMFVDEFEDSFDAELPKENFDGANMGFMGLFMAEVVPEDEKSFVFVDDIFLYARRLGLCVFVSCLVTSQHVSAKFK